jgi:hypothetical protein
MSTSNEPISDEREHKRTRFLTTRMIAERWACSLQHVKRLKAIDPDFPTRYRFGLRTEAYDEEDVALYERSKVVGKPRTAA